MSDIWLEKHLAIKSGVRNSLRGEEQYLQNLTQTLAQTEDVTKRFVHHKGMLTAAFLLHFFILLNKIVSEDVMFGD